MSSRELLGVLILIFFAYILIVVGNSFGYVPQDLMLWGPIVLVLIAIAAFVLFIKEHL